MFLFTFLSKASPPQIPLFLERNPNTTQIWELSFIFLGLSDFFTTKLHSNKLPGRVTKHTKLDGLR
jgi:hypothetical protein